MTKITNFFKLAIACIICFTVQINSANAAWPPAGISGDGSQGDPWQITTITQLENLADYVNGGNGLQTVGKYYMLMNDIAYPVQGNTPGWSPIGNNAINDATFQGNFDGNGKKVTDIMIKRDSTSYIGLFGYVFGAYIHDLGVEIYRVEGYMYVGGLIGRADYSIIENCYATGNVIGTYAVGGLVGYSASSTINPFSIISNSYSVCDVSGSTDVGGFVGMNSGTIETSYAGGNVTATKNEAGGFVGATKGIIIDCYATGDVAGTASYMGGFVGVNTSCDITYCYATGDIAASENYIGGFVGENQSGATIRNCVSANHTVSGVSNVGRVSGTNTGILSNNYAYDNMTINGATVIGGTHNNVNGEDKSMAALMSFNFYNTGSNWLGDKPWSIDTNDNSLKSWKICDGETLPFLQWEGIACNVATDPCDEPHAGTEQDPFLICTVQDLMDFRDYVNNGNTTIGKYWKMMDDLDLVGISNWNPIGNNPYPFQGNFDGNDKVISNLTINMGSTNYIGLFSRIFNAEIKNLGIEACQITGNWYVGALVGNVEGNLTIENCYVTGSNISGDTMVGCLIGRGDNANITIENCHVIGSNIFGDAHIGSLIGRGSSSNIAIENCYVVTGSVTGTMNAVGGFVGSFANTTPSQISNSYTICEVSGDNTVGGLIGNGRAIIEKSYTSGNIQCTYGIIGGMVGSISFGSSITDCYATGNILGASNHNIGGLVGDNFSIITNCYATGDIITGTSANSIGGLVGANSNSIANCYATGKIVTGDSGYYIGGLVGINTSSSYGSNITNCYATGDISGTGGTSIGGLVGENRNGAAIRNCVAANTIVSGGISDINRVAGRTYGILSNNYAYEDMLVNGVTVIGGTQNNVNGEDKPMSTFMSFNFYDTGSNWYNNVPWDIAANDNPSKVWKICDTQTLPFFQWQGIVCSKRLPYDEDEEGYTAGQNGVPSFFIFPNPTSGQLRITNYELEITNIEVFDVMGKTVFPLSTLNSQLSTQIDVSHLPAGMYFVRIMTETGAEVQKFVKK